MNGSDDVGLLAFLLFNLVHLKQGEALYTPAGVPHAYLCGNIIECMANSDNVVRVGLTPKFKDAPTLLNIVDATPQEPQVMGAGGNTRERNYLTPAHEFELTRWSLDMEQSVEVKDRQGPGILIVIEGVAMLTWADGELLLEKGDSVLIPDVLDAYGMSAVGAPVQVFRTSVPEEGLL